MSQSALTWDIDQLFVGEIDDVFLIALGNEATGESFLIQLAADFDEQGQALGMDTYCLCMSDGLLHYGGVANYEFAAEHLTLVLDPAAAEVFDSDRLQFIFTENSTDVESLRRGLNDVFGLDATR